MSIVKQRYLKIHPNDNLLVALEFLKEGTEIVFEGNHIVLKKDVKAKHKFTYTNLDKDAAVYMYGVQVGTVNRDMDAGELITVDNTVHATDDYQVHGRKIEWTEPDVSEYLGRTFNGFERADGKVGTANYWIVIPMVFCENRNVLTLQDAFIEKLGYKVDKSDYSQEVDLLIQSYKDGYSSEQLIDMDLSLDRTSAESKRLFKNVDGVKFLTHQMGCGGTRLDSDALCGLLAGYVVHPNVAGATILSLGCQHAQVSILKEEIRKRNPNFDKPLYVFEQQKEGTEEELMVKALKSTFAGLVHADQFTRTPAPLSKLCIGLECGGSDGFSGISANPVLGYVSDMLVALGGSVILSEFPELCGVEQELSDRCITEELATHFLELMRVYNDKAVSQGSGFYMNPSPGNIRDGLITDAMKSAGAAKKAGTSPVVHVADYPELADKPGLNLLCTPGNDVESTTAEVGAGANLVLFTTGLGTPTGNPIAPVVKVSSNTAVYEKMNDIIDFNCGEVIDGNKTIEQSARELFEKIIKVASGEEITKAVLLGQDDFIPWRRGVSL